MTSFSEAQPRWRRSFYELSNHFRPRCLDQISILYIVCIDFYCLQCLHSLHCLHGVWRRFPFSTLSAQISIVSDVSTVCTVLHRYPLSLHCLEYISVRHIFISKESNYVSLRFCIEGRWTAYCFHSAAMTLCRSWIELPILCFESKIRHFPLVSTGMSMWKKTAVIVMNC